jgi:hypothetical protein
MFARHINVNSPFDNRQVCRLMTNLTDALASCSIPAHHACIPRTLNLRRVRVDAQRTQSETANQVLVPSRQRLQQSMIPLSSS